MGQLVSGYLDFAERQAEREQAMTMRDWAEHLDRILTMSGEQLLQGNGSISHKQAVDKAMDEYKKYKARTLSTVEEDYLNSIKILEKKTEKMLKQLQKHRITSRQCMREGLYGMPIGAGNCKSLCSSVQHTSFRQIFLLNFVKYPCNTTVFLRIFSLSA